MPMMREKRGGHWRSRVFPYESSWQDGGFYAVSRISTAIGGAVRSV